MRKIINTFKLLILLTLFSLYSYQKAYAQKTIVEVKGNIVSDKKIISSKIKSVAPRTDENPKPAIKPSKLERQKGCEVQCNNKSGYFIEIYLDGFYQGTVAPWSEIWVISDNGFRTVYGVTTGKTKEWTIAGNCLDENYIWNLK